MEPVVTALFIAIVATLYASVGLAGASGYLAVLAIVGVDPLAMKGASLLLNGLVALIGSWVFLQGCWERLQTVAAIAVPAVPMAFLGGLIRVPEEIYLPVVGSLLILSAARLLWPTREDAENRGARRIPLAAGIALGGTIGFASGITGTGGGIFLLPALQLLGWADPKDASRLVAPFVLVSSVAGLTGYLCSTPHLPIGLVLWAPAAMLGGLIGARLGRDRLNPTTLRRVLAVLLIAAGFRLFLT
ncbi:sulfite exporter TauE/SafE family protein [Tautonia marina]|uniref:sulfite exporter TauE/SafE family protein n=1 Tax=Tautonia marina TaxID=2653855 RepID=UPI001260E748|nr:sulfite exporter TauE/SafE family protein [Tautonia marina]